VALNTIALSPISCLVFGEFLYQVCTMFIVTFVQIKFYIIISKRQLYRSFQIKH
jgi:hypothetical protein